jgi:hypothetical protein
VRDDDAPLKLKRLSRATPFGGVARNQRHILSRGWLLKA